MARFVTANGLRFAYRQVGPADGPLALLLHGFPDTPATWRHLAPRLADAGFRVVTPWMRGYAPTTIPHGDDFALDTLAADANRLHAVLGGSDDAVLVGHDWGALTGYRAAAAAPQRWRRLVTLAVPPVDALRGAMRSPRQWRRSWYTAAAQLPWERWAPDRAMARIEGLWRDWSPRYRPTDEDLGPLRAAMQAPGGLAAMLGYYRAQRDLVARQVTGREPASLPPQPTLYLQGAEDGCLGAEWAAPARDVLRRANASSHVDVVPRVGHFLHLEDPDGVGSRVEAWLAD